MVYVTKREGPSCPALFGSKLPRCSLCALVIDWHTVPWKIPSKVHFDLEPLFLSIVMAAMSPLHV